MKKAKVTIKDVARTADVSIATVSRVLNKNYYVSPAIEKKVLSAVEEIGYFPDSIARSLKNNRSLLVGLIVSDITNSYFVNMAKSIMDVIRTHNYNLIVCSTQTDKEKEKDYLNTLVSLKVAGIIINSTGQNDELLAKISQKTPVTLIHRRIRNTSFIGDFIDSDNKHGAYILTLQLLSKGHRKIGIILGYLSISTAQERLEGIKQAFSDYNIQLDENCIFYGDFTEECGYEGAKALVSAKEKPTALLTMNNAVIIGALKFLRTHNIRIPEDISIGSYGSLRDIDLMYVRPTLVTTNPFSIGSKAANLILERMEQPQPANREIIFNSELITGDSICTV